MKIRVLGCHGSSLPGYNTTSFLLDDKVLLDGGAITSVLTEEEQSYLEYILVTHAHLDHIRDIMFLADNLCSLKRERPLTVLSTPFIVETLKYNLFNGVVWPDFTTLPTPENPVLKFETILPGHTVSVASLDVTAINVNHAVETVGYVIETKDGSAIFLGDTGPTEEIWRVAVAKSGLEAIFVETSLPDNLRDLADKAGHLTPASLEQELRKLGDLRVPIYLYHMKIQHQEVIKEEISRLMNNNIHTLEDGQIVQIGAL